MIWETEELALSDGEGHWAANVSERWIGLSTVAQTRMKLGQLELATSGDEWEDTRLNRGAS